MGKMALPPMGGGKQDLMKQAMKMQEDMKRVQEGLLEKTATGSAGGGMVVATANGNLEVTAIKINPEVVSPEDVEMLQDLVVSAVREAQRAASEMAKAEMAKVTGGLSLPGLF